MDSVECRVNSKKSSKWRSTKWWVTVWAMCLTTFIIITGKSEFASVLMMLAGVPVAYIGANVVQKKIYNDKADGGSQ